MRLTFDSIFYSGAITYFAYPSANWTLLLQERTGHLGAQPVETHVYPTCFWSSLFFCFVRHFEFSSWLPLYTSSQTPVSGTRFPVPRSPFLLLLTSVLFPVYEFLVCKETVVLRRWERSKQKFGFIKRVDKG